jgi:hypothetical protein
LNTACNTAYNVVTATPVVGHAVGTGMYIAGNTEEGNKIMISASRTTASTVGIGVGFLVGGPAGAAAGAVIGGNALDGLATGIDSAVHQEYRPHGTIASVTNMVHRAEDGNNISGDIFEVVGGTALSAVGGYLGGRSLERVARRQAMNTMNEMVQTVRDNLGVGTREMTENFINRHTAIGEHILDRLNNNRRIPANTVSEQGLGFGFSPQLDSNTVWRPYIRDGAYVLDRYSRPKLISNETLTLQQATRTGTITHLEGKVVVCVNEHGVINHFEGITNQYEQFIEFHR